MRMLTVVTIVASLTALGSQAVSGQNGYDLFQRAAIKERADGDLHAAIQLYQRILSEHSKDRALTARTLISLGGAYEKLGSPNATSAYQSVVEEYPDQRESLRLARQRLGALSPDAGSTTAVEADPTFTLLRDNVQDQRWMNRPARYDISPDGRHVVLLVTDDMERPDGLYISDRAGTVVRPLITTAPGEGGFQSIGRPHWSPDGRRIAFSGRKVGREGGALFVIEADGSGLRQVGDQISRVTDLTWTADGGAVTYVERVEGPGGAGSQIHTRTLDGQTVQVTRGAPLPNRIVLGDYSSDGRWLAFQLSDGSGPPVGPEIWILPAEGGRAIQVTHSEGFDGHPAWGSDGRLYFASERGEGTNIWSVAIDTGSGIRSGEPRQVTFYSDAQALYPRVVDGGSGLAFVLRRSTSIVRVADATGPKASHAVVRGFFPQLSPDGDRVYYQGEGPGQEGIFAVSREGGTPLQLTQGRTEGNYEPRFDVSSDGGAIVYVGPTEKGRAVFVVPTSGGTPRHVVDIAEESESVVPVWSPDGSQLAFATENGMYVAPREGGTPNKIAHMWWWASYEVKWSPDGQYLAAFGYAGPDVRNQVFVVSATGGEPRRLTTPEEIGLKAGLQWHPDSQRLTYMYYDYADGADGDGIRVAYLDGRPTSLLVDEPDTWDYIGVWSPDGTGFYYLTSPDNGPPGWKTMRRDSATGAITEHRAVHLGGGTLPAWSQDGSTMVWSLGTTVNQLWLMENFN